MTLAPDTLDDVISETLGSFRDIGIGPERTIFRKTLLHNVLAALEAAREAK